MVLLFTFTDNIWRINTILRKHTFHSGAIYERPQLFPLRSYLTSNDIQTSNIFHIRNRACSLRIFFLFLC